MTLAVPSSAADDPTKMDLGGLFSALHPELLRNARASGASAQDAEDAVADAFLALARLPAERWPANPRAYLHAVVRNAARRRGGAAREVPTPQDELDRPSRDVDRLEGVEQSQLVGRALAALTAREQRLLEGSLLQGLGVERLGAELGLSVTATTTALARARANLRCAYLTAEIEPELTACGADPAHLARVLLGTASERMRSRVDRHAAGCEVCHGILGERRRPRIGRSALVIGLSALGAGALATSQASSAEALPLQAMPPQAMPTEAPTRRGPRALPRMTGPVAALVAVLLGGAGTAALPTHPPMLVALRVEPASVTLEADASATITVRNDAAVPVDAALEITGDDGDAAVQLVVAPDGSPAVTVAPSGRGTSVPLGGIVASGSTRVTVTALAGSSPGGGSRSIALRPVRLDGSHQTLGASAFDGGSAESAAHRAIHPGSSSPSGGSPVTANSSSFVTIPPARLSIRPRTMPVA